MKELPTRGRCAVLLALFFHAGCGPPQAGNDERHLPRVLSAHFPVRLLQDGQELVFPRPPLRVLPANAAWIDYVSVLLEPGRVVAVPAEAFGYSRLSEAAGAWAALPPFPVFEGERVLALEPDLVLAHGWQNPETIATLRRAHIPVLVLRVPETWSEITATLELLGLVLGVDQRAQSVLQELETRRARLDVRSAPFAALRALSYTNLGAGGWASAGRTTGDVLLALAGLRNAAAEAGWIGDVPVDGERLLALAPDLFLVGRPDRSESSAPSEEYLLADPALQELEAVRAHRIVTLPPALFTSASPELLTGAERVIDQLEQSLRADPASAVSSER